MKDRKYWIGVVSKNHIDIGISGKFIQVCHGKKWPLVKMNKGDIIFIYSPKVSLNSTLSYQKITACGIISDDIIYPYEMFEGFKPFRRNVEYMPISELSLAQLNTIYRWSEYKQKLRWGFFEIDEAFAKSLLMQLEKNC